MISLVTGIILGAVVVVLVPAAYTFVKKQVTSVKNDAPAVIAAVKTEANTVSGGKL